MTQSRDTQVSLDETPFYHCMVRCVRRAYLCGDDYSSGQNFDHRKQWLVSRLRFLSYVYAIDICAYAIMSNHYHVVLHVDKGRAESWSEDEVVERWLQLYNGHMLVDRWLQNRANLSTPELQEVEAIIAEWRQRLYSLSWFMRGVNETIARMANDEDNCKGRFWEGRFKSQALLDEGALLTCMAYVDLNPVRAAITDDLATSDFTSIQQRIFNFAQDNARQSKVEKVVRERVKKQANLEKTLHLDELPKQPLMSFDGRVQTRISTALPFTREDYFQLVDATGRAFREDKRGSIKSELPSLVNRLGIDPDKWLDHIRSFGNRYANCVGHSARILEFSRRRNKQWGKGVSHAAFVSVHYAKSG